jgi:hypothetical protein
MVPKYIWRVHWRNIAVTLIVPLERNIPALYLRWAIDALPMGHLRGRNWSLNFDFIGWELAEFYDKPGPFLGPHVLSLPEAG